MIQKNIGKLIAHLRKENMMTQEELANKLSVTNKSVSKWERGKSFPETEKIYQLCSLFNISFNEFFSGQKDKESSITPRRNIIDNKALKVKQIILLLIIIILFAWCLLLLTERRSNKVMTNPTTIQGTFLLGNELSNAEYIVIDQDMNIFRYHQHSKLEQGNIEPIKDNKIYLVTFNNIQYYVIYHTNYIEIAINNQVYTARKISDKPTYINVIW